MLIISLGILEEEDKIAIESDITCVIYADIPGTRFSKKNEYASDAEVALEPASELSSDERGDAEVSEEEVVELIYDYANDEDEGKFESPYQRRGEME